MESVLAGSHFQNSSLSFSRSKLVKASQGKIFKPTAQSPETESLITIPEKQNVPAAIALPDQTCDHKRDKPYHSDPPD